MIISDMIIADKYEKFSNTKKKSVDIITLVEFMRICHHSRIFLTSRIFQKKKNTMLRV